MANLTRAGLGTVRDANFPTNNNNEITASDLRDWLTDGIDSFLTQKDKNVMEEVIWEAKSNNLTAGATTDLSLANGNFVHITGTTTTINSFGICDAGSRFILVFKGVYTLDYDATQLILPGTANITTANNDCCMIVSEGSGNWRVVGYFPIAGGGGGGTVTSVTATAPLSSTGGSAPDISIPQANGSTDGFLDSADWTTFNGKQDALSAGTGISIVTNTVTNTAPDQIVGLTAGTGIGVTGTYPNFTISNTSPSSGGTVTAVTASSPLSSSGGTAPNITLGTVPIANGGTNATATPTNGGVAYGTGTAYAFTTAGTSGQILQSNGAAAPSWVAAPAATLTIGSSVVSGATAGRLLLTTTSGANQVLNQDSLLNYDTTNDRLGIGVASPTATLHLAAGVAANPQMLLVPSAVTPSGTTNGSIWCNTVSSNTRLTMYKDTGYTNVITLDRNPDLATSGSGIIQADANGTLSKGADLTALGIYAQTNSITAITTGSGSLIGTVTGITTLPANFFGVGKTIETKFSGLITMPNGSPVCTIDFKVTDGTTTSTLSSLVYDTSNMSGRVYMVSTQLTCRTTGAGATFGVSGQMIVNHTGKSQETVFITPGSVAISGSLSTASALTLQVVVTWTGTAGGSIDTRTHFCNYIN